MFFDNFDKFVISDSDNEMLSGFDKGSLKTRIFTGHSFKTCMLVVLFFLLLLIHAAFIQANAVYAQADSISNSVLRLRVIANSDSQEDQSLKLVFKSRLCEALKPYLEICPDVDTASEWIQKNLDFVQEQAENILTDLSDSSVSCTVEFTKSIFPVRTYGDLTFPPGNYRTLLVTLGNGEGHNWWCVLYPSLCFTDESTASFTDQAREELQKALDESDYEALEQGITFRFRIAEMAGQAYAALLSSLNH